MEASYWSTTKSKKNKTKLYVSILQKVHCSTLVGAHQIAQCHSTFFFSEEKNPIVNPAEFSSQ